MADTRRFEYTSLVEESFNSAWKVALEARAKGFDPTLQPESGITADLAERVEKSVGPQPIAGRIRELLRALPREEVAFKIAEEVVLGQFSAQNRERAAEQAVRTALAILDEGVTVAPLQGISSVKIRQNPDGSQYLAIYFAGPIRAAGGTDMGLTLVIADYVRHLLGLDRYRATEAEAGRFVEELRLCEREVARFQFRIPDEQVYQAILNLPVEATGVETDPVEVTAFRNLPRIETNRVRGGGLRVVNDGLLGRSQKVTKIVEKLAISGWDWLKEIQDSSNDNGEAREFVYMEDVLGGRPIFSFPGAVGGFRLRYGRSRNTGLSSVGAHPATIGVLADFLATGTQLKLEKPGKAGILQPVDGIDPPTVLLKDGTVIRLDTYAQAKEIAPSIKSVLYLGDLLVGFGEFLENNRPLLPSGFVEEWWAGLMRAKLSAAGIDHAASECKVERERLERMISVPYDTIPTPSEAVTLSSVLRIPIHPKYLYYWENITGEDLSILRSRLSEAPVQKEERIVRLPLEDRLKSILENLGVPHSARDSSVIVGEESEILFFCLKPGSQVALSKEADVSSLLGQLTGIEFLRKAPTLVGARMGRPEKAKERLMKPPVHCLFPIGLAGEMRRDLVTAAEKTAVPVEIASKKCPSCGEVSHLYTCPKCHLQTIPVFHCRRCRYEGEKETCPICRIPTLPYSERIINMRELLYGAVTRLSVSPPEELKGVRGLTNETRAPEPLEKGILRSRHKVFVFKDGTVRFDMTNAVLTHFKPSEVSVPVEHLRKLGYVEDHEGKPLVDPEQICALKPQDIIVSEKAAQYLLHVSTFIDELLTKFYGLKPFYNSMRPIDLIGHLVIGLSPHTSVGVIGRIIGFTKASVCFAHPFWQASKRRDADGDEDSVSLLLDVLINFSRAFLPARVGGLMDAPLLINLRIQPTEVARQALNIEAVKAFPISFYENTLQEADPKNLTGLIATTGHLLTAQFEGDSPPIAFTHPCHNINEGNLESSYKRLKTMLDKIKEQLRVAETLRSVKAGEVARRILSTHLLRDVTGNLKAFSSQELRCTKCNSKFRRPPLSGKCIRCGGKLSLTVYRGTIEKYVEAATQLVRTYNLGKYHEDRLRILKSEIESLFQETPVQRRQKELADFA